MYSAIKHEKKLPGGTCNIGDMVQTVAALQFLPKLDYYFNRRQSPDIVDNSLQLPKSFAIMNSWYGVGLLPAPNKITPFYISIHINQPEMLTPKVVAHLQKHQPIGARDRNTLALLESHGIDSYYSGCLTLSFPQSNLPRSGKVYIVDIDDRGLKLIPDELKKKAIYINYKTYKNWQDTIKVQKGNILRPLVGKSERLREFLEVPKVFLNSEFRSFFPRIWTDNEFNNLLHMFKARTLLNMYRQADLVITSRLHCAAPSLAFGTPVVFLARRKHQDGDVRFEAVGRYIPLNMDASSSEDINWHPQPVNIENHRRFLRMISQKAVEMGKNPLQEIPLTRFYEDSGWNG
ncbi:MAG: polysaccharide pyruvyl transferase family protein [Cyanobacteriota bacterium]|nr:polysaccharide pyruvyl transferase family protein [Cyanobacteriota bacterium]